jgi:hypothetical protein
MDTLPGGPFFTDHFIDLYPVSNATGSIEPPPKKKYTRTAEQKEADELQIRGANEKRM